MFLVFIFGFIYCVLFSLFYFWLLRYQKSNLDEARLGIM